MTVIPKDTYNAIELVSSIAGSNERLKEALRIEAEFKAAPIIEARKQTKIAKRSMYIALLALIVAAVALILQLL